MMLQHLGYKDLIVCSMVCKCFYKLVKEAVQLSYIVELGVDGFVDGPPSDLGTCERLQILLDLPERWRTFDWVKREIVNLYPTKRKFHMEYAQGLFSQIMRRSSEEGQYDSSIFSTVLPTHSTQAAEYGSLGEDHQHWTHFCMDPAADVIIFAAIDTQLLNGTQLGTHSIEVESYLSFVPRSLSSNGTRPHPLCRSECLQLMAGTRSASILDPQIAGDMVGVTIIACGKNSIAIYNWQSGELVILLTPRRWVQIMTHLDPWPVKDFAFLSPRSFVLSSERWISPRCVEHAALLLFTFCDDSSDGVPWTVATGVVKHIVTLVLPEVAEGQYSSGYVNTTSCASYHPRGIPFKVADPSRVLVYDAGQDTSPLSVRMVIHTDVFAKARKLLSTESTGKGRNIPWDAWGPEYTRVFTHNYVSLAQNAN
ncbi:hypothetical protein EWM64_g3119 [Hericium alpestre]|uniref:F-box domain-containing protein n=1 Tax=Hericium alpestre TaxID=135208 RepID=A0A4Z0A3I8_9AGAM|nr:hypothetical protein EWM64_g3119 [Hericium alpestre]